MDDLISRLDAIEAVQTRIKQIGYENDPKVLSIRQAIRDVPTVNPVRHGKWMGTVCTACGTSEPYYYDFEYCPHCGAKMDG